MSDVNEVEIWEGVTDSQVWITVTNELGRDREVAVGGPGGRNRRIRIKTGDRILNEERNPEDNPFVNGFLRRVDGDFASDEQQPGKTDAQLLGLLQAGDDFEDFLMEESELSVRRLWALAEGSASDQVSVGQHSVIRRVLDRRWPQRPVPSEQLRVEENELFS